MPSSRETLQIPTAMVGKKANTNMEEGQEEIIKNYYYNR